MSETTLQPPSSIQPLGARHIKVLLIEDDPVDAESVQRLLSPWNATKLQGFRFDLEHVLTLAAGLERLESDTVDLILLDLFLPDSHGIGTFERVWAASRQLPIVVLSGYDDQETALQALHEGAQDFLVKHEISRHWLLKSLSYAIERKAHEAEQEQLVGRLRHALDEVNALRGLLCICAWCGKIKNEHEEYVSLREYVQDHTEARFTHGLCPRCEQRMFEDPTYGSEPPTAL